MFQAENCKLRRAHRLGVLQLIIVLRLPSSFQFSRGIPAVGRRLEEARLWAAAPTEVQETTSYWNQLEENKHDEVRKRPKRFKFIQNKISTCGQADCDLDFSYSADRYDACATDWLAKR